MTLQALLTHLGFCTCLGLLSALVVRAMIRTGVVDVPTARSSHTRPTPKGGGVGVVVAFLTGILVLYKFAAISRLADPYFRGVILAALGIAVVAFLDDRLSWPASVKLTAQVAAAAVAVGSGLTVDALRVPYIHPIELGWFGAVATVIWIVAATNAVNFIDGLNGLASGVTVIASLFLAGIAASQGGWFIYFACLMLAAGLLGFLPYNFPHARIFMGDVGSQFCGFLLAVLAVAAGRFEKVELSVVLVPMLLFGVLFDVAFTLMRRALAGDRLTEAHRSHIYQVAHRTGMDATTVTLLHWGFAAWGGVCCLAFISSPASWKPLWILLVVPPQCVWLAVVVAKARRAGVVRW